MAILSRAPVALMSVLCGLMLCPGPAYGGEQAREADVKAAFLYNFTKYINWPPGAFEGTSDPFRICVVSDQQFTRSVGTLVAGETAHGRPLEVTVPRRSDLRRCHILFVGRNEAERAVGMLAATSGRAVLTVGETPGFLDQGGAVLFEVENNRVRFDINLGAATRAGLTVSSKLVRVARHVREGPVR